MTPADELETFTTGQARAVDLPEIERQLRQLWSSAGASESGGAVTRASLLNLIVVAPGPGADIAESIARVAAELPCRVLELETAPARAGEPELEAWISAHCRPGGPGGKQVCCEQITIRAASAGFASLPSTLLGLLLPDLPTVLYWPHGAQLDGPLLQRLARHIDRLVVDSAAFTDPDADLARLERWRGFSPAFEVADLNWGRLEAWRELVAAFFDTPPFDAALTELDALEIEHDPLARVQAVLCAGWIASRLHWQPVRATFGGVECTAPAGRVTLRLAPRLAGPPAGSPSLCRVVLHARSGTRFVVETDARHTTLLEARIECDAACPLPQRLDRKRLEPEAELVRLLMRVGRNPAFDAALATGAQIVGPPSHPA